MATQEIGLNEALAAAGIEAVETDLAELIVQLADDKPSHILVPAIHYNRTQIREMFARRMPGVDPSGLTDEPPALAEAARAHLREQVPLRQGGDLRAPTSRSRRPAPWWWWSPRATAGCA